MRGKRCEHAALQRDQLQRARRCYGRQQRGRVAAAPAVQQPRVRSYHGAHWAAAALPTRTCNTALFLCLESSLPLGAHRTGSIRCRGGIHTVRS